MLRVISCLFALLAVSSCENTGCTPGINNLDVERMFEGRWFLPKYLLKSGETLREGDYPSIKIDMIQQRIDVPPEVTGNMTVAAAQFEVEQDDPLYRTRTSLGLAGISRNDGIIYPAGILVEVQGERERVLLPEKIHLRVIGADYDSWLLLSYCETLLSHQDSEPGALVLSRSPTIDADTMRTVREYYSSLLNNPPHGHPGENTAESRQEDRLFFLSNFVKAFINDRK